MINYNKNRIVTNNLLHPTKREIRNWNSIFMTTDGPNDSTFIDLVDIAIPYDSYYTSRVVLPAFSKDYKLNYNTTSGLTFLLIKVTYNGNYDFDQNIGTDTYDSQYYYNKNNYNIEYYYESNSGITYPINKLLLLNGSFTHKIENIYLNNPLCNDVVLDVFHANITEPIPIPVSSATTISNLYYNDIITNQVDCVNSGMTGTTTGSTMFIVSEYKSSISGYTIIQYNINYSDIISIQQINNDIIVSTTTRYYTLKFLNDFHCNQAFCRMIFAYTSYFDFDCRYLTIDNVYNDGEVVDCSS